MVHRESRSLQKIEVPFVLDEGDLSNALLGGPGGTRTLDPHNAIVVRSQLRYGPLRRILLGLEGNAGGAEGIRTPDLYSAIVALSQLSYSPPRRLRGPV
jgi:hypothetical protein